MLGNLSGHVIPGSVLRLDSLIGQGSFGAVYHASSVYPSTLTNCAVKVIRKLNSQIVSDICQEIQLHFRVSSFPNVLPLLQTIESTSFAFLITPYIPFGTLAHQIYDCHHFQRNPAHIKPVFAQLVSAIGFCHQSGIAHGDIKPENVVCGPDQIYLIDFGLATNQPINFQTSRGTLAYMSPECLGGFTATTHYFNTFANDIWSLGIVLINLITSSHPWTQASVLDHNFCHFVMDPTILSRRYNLILNHYYQAILAMLHVDEDQRINVFQLYEGLA